MLALRKLVTVAPQKDPRQRNNNLDTEDVSNALNYIKDVDEQIVPEVMKFMSKAPPYNSAYFEGTFKDADPVSWWKSGVKMGFDQNLAKVAISLVSAASSSGGLERCLFLYAGNHLRKAADIDGRREGR